MCAIVLAACSSLFQATAMAGPGDAPPAPADDPAANAPLATMANSPLLERSREPWGPAANMAPTARPNPAADADFNARLGPGAIPPADASPGISVPEGLCGGPKAWTSPEGLGSTLQVMLLLTVLSLAPAVLLMTTCFVRVVVVLSLLKQALGTQQLPPTR